MHNILNILELTCARAQKTKILFSQAVGVQELEKFS
jgi:hypothetical protein